MSTPAPITRRALLSTAAVGACAMCSCTSSTPAPAPAKSTQPIDIGPPDRFARDGIYDDWADAHGFFIVRQANQLYALSSICTHRHYDLETKGTQIVCPKHGSLFTPTGQVIKGPATTPLPRLGIQVTPAKTIVVDPSTNHPASVPLS
jgi:cytochrome b6-f complex iron-sulfur subunit